MNNLSRPTRSVLSTVAALAALAGSAPLLSAAESKPAEGVTVETGGAATPAKMESPARRDARMAWWREAKFGLFIHWGVYAVPAGKWGDNTSYGEWIMNSAKIPVTDYRGLAARFNPVKYDPQQWVDIAADAGMKYIVITSKHHDGFALFPSAASTWNIADASPYKKDLLAPLVQDAHAKGLKIGFYYSQSQDWMNPGGAKSGFSSGDGWDEAHKGDFDTYLKNVALPQTREILSRYPIDILWWDTPMDMTAERAKPFADLVVQHPKLITNNRLGGNHQGDTATPEQFVPATGYPGDWETCMTLNGHWGYNAADDNWKSSTDLIRKLADICAKGGNFLLNVGPTAEGEFPPACVERLRDIGQWLKVNGESIYGTTRGPFAYLPWGVATRKDQTLYLHVFEWPDNGRLIVPLGNQASTAKLLATGEDLSVRQTNGRLVIDVPSSAPHPAASVVALEITGEPITRPLPTVGALVTATASAPGADPANVIDGTAERRWRAPKEEKSAALDITLKAPATIGAFALDEPDVWPRMKQSFLLEAEVDGQWKSIASGKTDGHGKSGGTTPATAARFRLTMECPAGSPGVAELQLYHSEPTE
jgi:alpha-L-fucosidase